MTDPVVKTLLLVVASAALCLLAAGSAGAAHVRARTATIGVFPSATTVRPTGSLSAGAAGAVSLNAAIGEQEDAIVVVHGTSTVAVTAPASIGPLPLKLFFAHFVSFGGRLMPDALRPWDGDSRRDGAPLGHREGRSARVHDRLRSEDDDTVLLADVLRGRVHTRPSRDR